MLWMGHTHHLVFPSLVAQWVGIRSTMRRQCEKWMGQNVYRAHTQYALECYFHPKLYNLVFFFFFNVYFMCMGILSAYHVCLPEESINAHGTEITDACEPSWGCWELNLCRLQEQQGILTPEPLLQSLRPSPKEASILQTGNKTRK